MPAVVPEGEVMFGMQLPIQTLTRTLVDPWEDDASVDDLVTVAQTAERSGMGFVGVCDHIAIPQNDYAKNMTTTWYDTVATLAFLAAHTSTVKLLSVVYIAAYRHPLATAKAFSTIDHLSGGRAILGVGAGHVEAEFEALGVDYSKRGKLLDETLEALTGAFDDTYVSHSGEFFNYENMGVGPAPDAGDLTIWVAGGGAPAYRRVGQYANGFIPFVNPHDEYPEMINTINRHAEAAGRGGERFDIGIMPPWMFIGDPPDEIGIHMISGSPEKIAEELRRERDLGANVFHLKFRGRSHAEYLEQIEQFGSEIAPLVRQ